MAPCSLSGFNGRAHGAAVVLLLALALGPSCCLAALNVGFDVADSMVAALRRSIFVDTAYLSEREEERCSSLDGPRCFGFLDKGPSSAELDGPGVVPERLLRGLGVTSGELDFSTPLYHELEALRQQLTAGSPPQELASPDDAAAFRESRSDAEHGALHFGDLVPDHKVPLTFSRGLPGGVVATWDGKWIVRSCFQGEQPSNPSDLPSSAQWLALPSPPSQALADPRRPMVLPSARALSRTGGGQLAAPGVTAVAELAGEVGYLRFSQPVVVRSLFVRWELDAGAPSAVIAGRLGLQSAWATHLDPKRLKHHGWIDVSGGSLRPVDELTFLAAPGLELAGLWAAAHSGDFADGGSERKVMMLEPVFNTSLNADVSRPSFSVKAQTISPAATPFLISLQEAVERKLRLHLEPSAWAPPHSHGVAANFPSVITTESVGPYRWTQEALAKQLMLEHELLAQPRSLGGAPARRAGEHLATALLHPLSSLPLPTGLRRELARERDAIMDALRAWVGAGGRWRHTDPTSLPANGTEAAVQSYIRAKRLQTKLDLLTAAFLHAYPQLQAQLLQREGPRTQGPWA
mmetsp:Transcript_87409/g.271581  ORF Transcript_87409/g.271581 Transcript_87409/m.271581 type:complete len:577 (+) Transcript_87409:55-1785(+)